MTRAKRRRLAADQAAEAEVRREAREAAKAEGKEVPQKMAYTKRGSIQQEIKARQSKHAERRGEKTAAEKTKEKRKALKEKAKRKKKGASRGAESMNSAFDREVAPIGVHLGGQNRISAVGSDAKYAAKVKKFIERAPKFTGGGKAHQKKRAAKSKAKYKKSRRKRK